MRISVENRLQTQIKTSNENSIVFLVDINIHIKITWMQFCSTKTHEQNLIFCGGPSSAKCFNFKSNELNFHSQPIYWENSFTLFPLFTAFAVQQKHMRIGLRLVSDWKCRHEWRRTLYRICVYVWRCLGRSQIDWHLCRTRSNWIRARTHTHTPSKSTSTKQRTEKK